MRVVRPFFISIAVLLGAGFVFASAANQTTGLSKKAATCLDQGKKQFAAQQYQAAKETFTRCVRLAPKNADTQLSLAGALLTLEDLDGAEKAFQTALGLMTRTSPYLSYAYSMLGDIALKRQKNEDAFAWYTKSLESNAANVNSLVGKGVIVEYQGDKKQAAEFYRSALAVEPLNLIARNRLINLEPDYMSDAEMLAALKQRYAIKPDVSELTDDMRQTFAAIHKAEQRRGIDYLKNKYPTSVPADYMVTLNKGTAFEREILTLSGYNALRQYVGQDAIGVFQRAGVPVQDVFKLRDLNGHKIFKEDNTLTENGYYAYTEALQNKKSFLLPNESVPPTQELLTQMARLESELKNAGYMEISRREFNFIAKQTKCDTETLRKELGVYFMPVSKTQNRYFILTRETPLEPKKSVPYYYLMKEKAKYDTTVKVPRNSLAQAYEYYGYTVCLDDGKLLN